MRFMNKNFCTSPTTNVTSSDIDPNFPVSNLKNPFRSKRVRTQQGTTTLAVVFDLITTEEIDSLVLLWPKEDGIRLSETATIKVQANATNEWTSPAVDQVVTISNDYVLGSHFFSSNQSYRYWRVLITDSGNPYEFIELGLVWLGKSLEVENAQNGFNFQLVDRSKIALTEFGHSYVDEYPIMAKIDFNYKNMDYGSVQILENAFRQNGTRDPVMVVLDADEDVFNKDHFIVYGKMSNGFEMQHVRYNIFDTSSISVLELA